jgi:hypothetical protein
MNRKQTHQREHGARKIGVLLPTKSVAPKKNPEPAAKWESRLRSVSLKVGGFFGLVATIVTIGSAVVLFRFDVSVEPYSLPDPKLPFSQLFSVQNTSQLFTIYELTPRCQIESMRDTRGNTFKFGGITTTREFKAELAPGAKTTATCSIAGDHQWTELLVNIIVQYKAPFGFRRCKAVTFEGQSAPNDTYVWAYNGTKTCEWFEYPPHAH